MKNNLDKSSKLCIIWLKIKTIHVQPLAVRTVKENTNLDNLKYKIIINIRPLLKPATTVIFRNISINIYYVYHSFSFTQMLYSFSSELPKTSKFFYLIITYWIFTKSLPLTWNDYHMLPRQVSPNEVEFDILNICHFKYTSIRR